MNIKGERAAWTVKQNQPYTSGWYYTRQRASAVNQPVLVRFYDKGPNQWWLCHTEEMELDDNFAEWLWVVGVSTEQAVTVTAS